MEGHVRLFHLMYVYVYVYFYVHMYAPVWQYHAMQGKAQQTMQHDGQSFVISHHEAQSIIVNQPRLSFIIHADFELWIIMNDNHGEQQPSINHH